jgi:ribosomal protein S18 acetylase RimI-like enzyme
VKKRVVVDGWWTTPLPWDSEFWGCRVGRIEQEPDGGRGLSLIGATSDVDLAYLLRSADDLASIQLAERSGFRTVDFRCEVHLDLDQYRPAISHDIGIRQATRDDLSAAASLASTSHSNTRFGNDPLLPRDRVHELYGQWIRRDADRDGWSIAVATSDDDELIGYVTYGELAPGVGTVGLIGVAAHARNLGLGSQLLDAAVDAQRRLGATTMRVVTQGGSQPAMRMYQRAGFTVAALDVWLHWHAS